MSDKPYLNPAFVTMNDAATLAGVTILTIQNWVKSGRVRFVRDGQRVYIEKASIPITVKPTPKSRKVGRPVVMHRDLELARRCREARLASGLSWRECVKALGVAESTLSLRERGLRAIPDVALSNMATLYGVSVKWLVSGHE